MHQASDSSFLSNCRCIKRQICHAYYLWVPRTSSSSFVAVFGRISDLVDLSSGCFDSLTRHQASYYHRSSLEEVLISSSPFRSSYEILHHIYIYIYIHICNLVYLLIALQLWYFPTMLILYSLWDLEIYMTIQQHIYCHP
jgi:hypothetical protein